MPFRKGSLPNRERLYEGFLSLLEVPQVKEGKA